MTKKRNSTKKKYKGWISITILTAGFVFWSVAAKDVVSYFEIKSKIQDVNEKHEEVVEKEEQLQNEQTSLLHTDYLDWYRQSMTLQPSSGEQTYVADPDQE